MFEEQVAAMRRLLGSLGEGSDANKKHRDRPRQRPPTKRARPRPTHWHAVTIGRGEPSCVAALKTRGMRYLAREAPQLPLPGCDAATCKCRYRHHEDRRANDPLFVTMTEISSRPLRRATD